jgi:hypothetical protein
MREISSWVLVLIFLILAIGLLFNINFVSAQTNTVCCERTQSGAFCQNVPAEECADGVQQVPTACESTSFCRLGTCFDSTEGTCLDNTPQLVCNDNGGVWSEESPPQCGLGCCVLGDQGAFVTLVRCKKLSAELGLETNYDSSIGSELECIALVQGQDRGACVFDIIEEGTKGCNFETRAECEGVQQEGGNGTQVQGEFFKDKLCSAEELGTICGPTTDTTCVPGKDEVYFVDTCGNPANIYDASKVEDQEYWANVKSKEESCNVGGGNVKSSSCGNCNYLLGSYCRNEDIAEARATYGDFICADLNCKSTSNGKGYLHGESWCVYNDEGSFGNGENSAGSEFFRHSCINGEEVVESCAGFRAEECIEDDIDGFSQAACRVNRWQDCASQSDRKDCENSDRRECFWKSGVEFGSVNGSSQRGACLPKTPPGLNFWEGGDTSSICQQGNIQCIVSYEKGIFGGDECVENCECLGNSWENERIEVCRALGDCGPAVNWIGKEGFKEGFKIKIGKVDASEEDDGGLFGF